MVGEHIFFRHKRNGYFRYKGLQVKDFFDKVFLSCELGVEKPHPEIFEKVDGKESIHVLGMNPPEPSKNYHWEMLGYAVLQALGVRSDEL